MKTKRRCICAFALLLCLVLFGCGNRQSGEIRHVMAFSASPQVLSVIKETAAPTDTPRPSATPPPTFTPVPTCTPVPTPAPTSAIEAAIASMPVEEKIGQLVMFGFSGTDKVSSEFKTIMQTYRIGNVILYGPNIDKERSDGGFSRCKKLTDSLRSANRNGTPLMIAIDVEGGDVTRFKWESSLLSAASLGKKNDPDRAERQFERIGDGLRSAGIDLDLAPVMDVAKKPSETFLDDRIISSSAETAGKIGAACIRGLHKSECLSLVKHFPGHGATASDSHKTTPVVKKTLAELEEYELLPFSSAIEAGADGVMVGHLSYPKIDQDNIASQSYFFITELLREELGFEGIVMSDDFRMDGLRKQSPLGEAAVNFILAGGDIILCGPNHEYQKQIMTGLYEAFDSGVLTEERIDESVARILEKKYKFD